MSTNTHPTWYTDNVMVMIMSVVGAHVKVKVQMLSRRLCCVVLYLIESDSDTLIAQCRIHIKLSTHLNQT